MATMTDRQRKYALNTVDDIYARKPEVLAAAERAEKKAVPRSTTSPLGTRDLGRVRKRGTHSPRSLARKALAYAKAQPEETTK